MSDAGYRARLFAIEWHAELWRRCGTPEDYCRRMMAFCSEYLEAEYYGVDVPVTDDEHINAMRAYLWRIFESPLNGPHSFG